MLLPFSCSDSDILPLLFHSFRSFSSLLCLLHFAVFQACFVLPLALCKICVSLFSLHQPLLAELLLLFFVDRFALDIAFSNAHSSFESGIVDRFGCK
jgi:hypothetical protein